MKEGGFISGAWLYEEVETLTLLDILYTTPHDEATPNKQLPLERNVG